jgi:cytochrome b561
MAAMVLSTLFIGIGMVSTLQPKFLTLIAIHRPLGIAILLFAVFRLGVRLWRGVPPGSAALASHERQGLTLPSLRLGDRHAAGRLVDAFGW